MTNWGFDDNGQTDDQGNNNSSPGGLRQFAEAQQQENRALKQQLEEIQKSLRNQQLSSVFNELGAPDALSQYQGEADPAKAREWVESQRKLFGWNDQGTSQTPEVNAQQQTPEGLPPMLQQQFEQFTQAGQQGSPLGSIEQGFANVNDAKNLDGLLAAMRNAQGRQ